MADDESWLYGEEGGDEGEDEGVEAEEAVPEAVQQQDQDDEERPDMEEPSNDGMQAMEDDDDDDDDESDDDIEITIDKDKIEAAKTTYQTIGLKKNNVIDIGFVPAPQKEKKGRFAVEEFDSIGTINGQPSVDHDVEAMEDKPWRKPGADITDYFNYGFTEDTWQAYCNRQKKMRMNESGAGLLSGHTPIMSTNKYSGGNIPILGGSSKKEYNAPIKVVVKDSTPSGITVMTHDKRVYSQKVIGNMDFSVPPPGVPPPGVPPPFSLPPPGVPPPGSDSLSAPPPGAEAPPPMGEFPPGDPFGEFGEGGGEFYGGYEPTAEAQWSVPPPANHWTAPPGDSHYQSSSAGPDRYRRRDSREDRPRDWDRSSSSAKRRSRSRSRERDRRSDRPDRDRRDRDRERDREREDRDRRIKKEKRSRSRSRSPKHKKSKKDKKDKDKEKDEKKEKEGAKEIKEEPKD